MNVPFADLKVQYSSIKNEIDAAIQNVITQTAFIGGSYVKTFEKEFAEMLGVKHCVSVANGTDAIYVVMRMLGIGAGDEVITVANSWISTSETITQTGARPVFVDVDEFFTIDVTRIESKITPRTKAIIPVHLYGQAAKIDALQAICKKHNLFLIEDCAQSHFSKYNGQFVGTFGNASTFSFYPGKNLGAYGDAGAIATNDDSLAERCRMYANHGSPKKHQHLMEGINSRLDGLQAAILSVKLKYIIDWTKLRVQNADQYKRGLADLESVQIPRVREGTSHTYHVYAIKAERRDELKAFLQDKGIETLLHYPTPLPFLPCYQYLNHTREDFPVAFANQQSILSLPMFPEMTEEQINYVVDNIKAFYNRG